MNLYILRHGLAAERAASRHAKDSDRPLTPKGKRKLWRTVRTMEGLGIRFDLILSSPYLRARQTAEIVAEGFGAEKHLRLSDALEPDGDVEKLIELLDSIRPAPEDVLLVGHEPYLSGLVSLLVTGQSGLSMALKKGGLCRLSVESLDPGRCASLEWLLTPKQMTLLAEV